MAGRRRHDRFEMTAPWVGSLRLPREVIVKPGEAGHLVVISHTGVTRGEVMRLGLAGAGNGAALRVRVADSWPIPLDGSVRYAAHVEVLPRCGQQGRQQMTAANVTRHGDIRDRSDKVGVLTRDVPVQLRNLSGSGCLLESSSAVEEGTVARVRMRIGRRHYGDDVRVIRCRRLEGAGATHHVGVEFAWTTRPGAASLRSILARLPGFARDASVVRTYDEAV